MPDSSISPAVLITIGVLLSVAVLSIYVSRVVLPMRIKSAYLKSITALATAVETRDSGTLGHAKRVAQYTIEVAKKLGLQGRDIERIEYAALLMDIGKANVPQALLNKSTPLQPDEWEILKSHPRMGAEMVAEVPFLEDIIDYILHHHEYWDGSGYPDGLKAEEIPLASRILSVAADYDAMISERPYHPRALTHEEAIGEIKRYVGVRYDPNVAEAFFEILGSESLAKTEAA